MHLRSEAPGRVVMAIGVVLVIVAIVAVLL